MQTVLILALVLLSAPADMAAENRPLLRFPDVYVMSVHGGQITRVTYHPGTDTVVGWHPRKNKIMFRSSRRAFSRFERLYLIGPDGSGLEELMRHEAVAGSFSPDGALIAYNRIARETRTWKRYRGLMAPDYRIFDAQGRWVVEDVGIEPDIVVDLDPAEMARGHDAQLMEGIECHPMDIPCWLLDIQSFSAFPTVSIPPDRGGPRTDWPLRRW